MTDQQAGFLLLVVSSLIILALGAIIGGQGFWDRQRSPLQFWATISLFTFLAFVGAYRLIVG